MDRRRAWHGGQGRLVVRVSDFGKGNFARKDLARCMAAFAGYGLVAATPLHAQEVDADASASLLTPLVIAAVEGLEFGELAVSPAGECRYTIDPAGSAVKSGDARCAFISGATYGGKFEVDCGADKLVQFSLFYTDLAPDGASFGASADPMQVDATKPGGEFQTLPCDSDGRSVVRAGGSLLVTPKAPGVFSGRVGTIRLEVKYD